MPYISEAAANYTMIAATTVVRLTIVPPEMAGEARLTMDDAGAGGEGLGSA